MLIAIVAFLTVLALGGAGVAFAGGARERQQKRVAQVAGQPQQQRGRGDEATNPIKRKNVQQLLKQIESKTAEQKQKLTMRRRLNQAGLPDVSVNAFWIASGVLGAVAGAGDGGPAFACRSRTSRNPMKSYFASLPASKRSRGEKGRSHELPRTTWPKPVRGPCGSIVVVVS